MSILGSLILAIAHIFDFALTVYMWIIIIAVIVSWVNPSTYNPIVRFLHLATDPVLRPVRKIVGHRLRPIDISPIIVIIVIILIQTFLIGFLMEFGHGIKG